MHAPRWLKRGDVTSGRVLQSCSWRVDHFFGGHKPQAVAWRAFLEPSFVKTESSLWGTTCHFLCCLHAKAVCLRKNMSHARTMQLVPQPAPKCVDVRHGAQVSAGDRLASFLILAWLRLTSCQQMFHINDSDTCLVRCSSMTHLSMAPFVTVEYGAIARVEDDVRTTQRDPRPTHSSPDRRVSSASHRLTIHERAGVTMKRQRQERRGGKNFVGEGELENESETNRNPPPVPEKRI